MKIEIQTTNDESFHFVNTETETTENEDTDLGVAIVINELQEEIQIPIPINKGPRSAPIENNTGSGWFSGTSWGD